MPKECGVVRKKGKRPFLILELQEILQMIRIQLHYMINKEAKSPENSSDFFPRTRNKKAALSSRDNSDLGFEARKFECYLFYLLGCDRPLSSWGLNFSICKMEMEKISTSKVSKTTCVPDLYNYSTKMLSWSGTSQDQNLNVQDPRPNLLRSPSSTLRL